MSTIDLKLKERVKELKCLYELSMIAWEAENDIDLLISRTLEILPRAMQHPALAEAAVFVRDQKYNTRDFDKCRIVIESALPLNNSRNAVIKVGYKPSRKSALLKPSFLPEEKKLLKVVARELSLFIKRASVEEEKQKLQLQLQHVERLAFVGELSAGIAHELNEPLARILGFAQLIKKNGNLSHQQFDDLERIIKASLYTREIIKKLMLFSRQIPQQITKVSLNSIIESILYFIDVRFQSRGISMVKNLDPNLPLIRADEVQMSQVLVNLITNAVHAMPGGGEINITTKKKGNFVSLTVKDTGTGMTSEIKEKIFEPFFTTKAPGHGTGLGLSVVQGIIDSHKGKILVKSTPGQGSHFEILLPLTHRK